MSRPPGVDAESGPPPTGIARRALGPAAALAALALAAGLLFHTSPREGNFWWSDAPRHALNGVFLKDFLTALPLRHPVDYATAYYLRYPALTILLYPPLFHGAEALVFALLGVSHWSAQLTVAVFAFVLGWGVYALARRWFPRAQAAALAVLFLAVPEMALWGRQVMLEIPAHAFLVWSLYWVFRYLDDRRPARLHGAVTLFLLGLYTKLSIVFMLGPALWLLFRDRGRGLLRDRHAWGSGLLLGLGLVPLGLLTLAFGRANVDSVIGIAGLTGTWASLGGWFWYLRRLPIALGWVVTGLAAAFLVASAVRRDWRLPPPAHGFFLLWAGLGYLLLSAIALKEIRHAVFILLPLVLFAGLTLNRLLPGRAATAALGLLAAATLAQALVVSPAPQVAGYREAADLVAARAPARAVVLFAGERDGSFIFNLRARGDRPDLSVLRADKLLLDIAIARRRGEGVREVREAEIGPMLDRHGVRLVVAQEDFWEYLAPLAALARVLRSGQFEEIARIPVVGNVYHADRALVVYRNLAPVSESDIRVRLDLPAIGRTIEGTLGGPEPGP